MPNRIIKESICRSEEIDALSWFEEVLFYRLIVSCDDYGRFDGRTKIIKGTCFPLKDVTEKNIEKALNKLSAVGLVRVYKTQGRPYLQLVTWAEHQRIRNQKSKYPDMEKDSKLLSIDNNCQQLSTVDSNCVRNPIQSESKSKSESNTIVCSELQADAEPQETPVITLPLNTGVEYPVMQSSLDEWSTLYPAIDVMQCLRNMRGWLQGNPTKRKTSRGITRFITTWLQKEQDKGGVPGYVQRHEQTGGSKVEQFAHEARRWANG